MARLNSLLSCVVSNIKTVTEVLTDVENLTVHTYYLNEKLKVIRAFVSSKSEEVYGVKSVEGELLFDFRNTPDLPVFSVENGYLVVDDVEANNYSIDEQGDLIYTE